MNAIRYILNVKNKKIIISLPDDFNSDKAEVIILPYHEINEEKSGKISDFFKNSPLFNLDLNLDRSKDSGRDIDLWNTGFI